LTTRPDREAKQLQENTATVRKISATLGLFLEQGSVILIKSGTSVALNSSTIIGALYSLIPAATC